jgi:hypothetical protein
VLGYFNVQQTDIPVQQVDISTASMWTSQQAASGLFQTMWIYFSIMCTSNHFVLSQKGDSLVVLYTNINWPLTLDYKFLSWYANQHQHTNTPAPPPADMNSINEHFTILTLTEKPPQQTLEGYHPAQDIV